MLRTFYKEVGMKTVIVSRHPGAMDWLRKHHPEMFPMQICVGCNGTGFVGEDGSEECISCDGHGEIPMLGTVVLSHASPDDVRGNRVIGILPEELSTLAAEYWKINVRVPAEYRGKELSCADLERFGCKIKRWIIIDPKDKNLPTLGEWQMVEAALCIAEDAIGEAVYDIRPKIDELKRKFQ
jgi:putative CRISPR-associated protein (TIGR02620 family)